MSGTVSQREEGAERGDGSSSVAVVEVSKRSSGGVSSSVASQLLAEGEPVGLSTKEYEAALAKHGYNEVIVKEQPVYLQILSRYLGIVPLFITTTAVLSAAIESGCSDQDDLYVRYTSCTR